MLYSIPCGILCLALKNVQQIGRHLVPRFCFPQSGRHRMRQSDLSPFCGYLFDISAQRKMAVRSCRFAHFYFWRPFFREGQGSLVRILCGVLDLFYPDQKDLQDPLVAVSSIQPETVAVFGIVFMTILVALWYAAPE